MPGYAILMLDAEGNISTWNKVAEKIKGYSAKEVIGKNISIFYTSADIKNNAPQNNLKCAINEGGFESEGWRVRKDGSEFWAHTVINALFDEHEKLTGFANIIRNISSNKKPEEIKPEKRLLSKTEDFYSVLDRMLDGFIMLDKNFCYTFLNKKVGLMIGMEPSSCIGKNVWELFPEAVNSETYHAFLKAMDEQRYIFNIDYYAPLDLWQENHIYPTLNGLSVFIRDISIQKRAEVLLQKSEAKFRRIFESNMVGFMFWNTDGKLLEANDRFLELIGYSKQDILNTSLHLKDISLPEYFDDDAKRLKEIEITGITKPREIEFLRKDGTRVPVLVGSALLGKNHPGEGVAYIMDITALKETENKIFILNEALEERVRQRTQELEMVNNELESFSYSVSHDLRAPLRAINGYSKILEEDYSNVLDNEGRRLVKVVQDNAKKMGMLIDDLLAFSRLGRKEVNKSLIQTTELTKHVVTEIEKITPHQAEIIIEELHPVKADYSLLVQVMTNLISNAIKYSSKKEKPVIKISSYQTESEIIYSVQDNGAGFEMEYAHKLFGVFQRLHSADAFEGTGVGLAIVQRIIIRHDGKVWAEGEPEKGATFYFSLPVI